MTQLYSEAAPLPLGYYYDGGLSCAPDCGSEGGRSQLHPAVHRAMPASDEPAATQIAMALAREGTLTQELWRKSYFDYKGLVFKNAPFRTMFRTSCCNSNCC